MATLDTIRSKAGCLVIAIGGALLAFLFGDIIQGGTSLMRDREMNAFTVNGKSTKIQDYEDRVSNIVEMYRAQGVESLTDAQTNQLRNQIFQGMVAEQILNEEVAKLGIAVSPAETFDLIQGENISPVILQNPMFANQETGIFDKVALLAFLKEINAKGNFSAEKQAQIDQSKRAWVDVENNVRQQKLNEKYENLIAGAIIPNKLETAYALNADKEVADIIYVQQSVYNANDIDIVPTDTDLKKFYNDFKENFRSIDKSVKVDLVYANITPSETDRSNAKEDIQNALEGLQAGQSPALVLDDYSDAPFMNMYLPLTEFSTQIFSADFLRFLSEANVSDVSPLFDEGDRYMVAKLVDKKSSPESLKVRHIVLAPAGSFEGQVDGDSLLTALKADPSSFAAAATAYSFDSNSNRNGGEIGWLNEAIATNFIDANFSEAIYAAKVGEPFAYNSRYGEHIILVEEAKPSVAKYNVAIAQRSVVPSSETQAALYNELVTFLNQNKNADLTAEALNAGFQVLTDVRVMASQPMIASNIDNSRQLVRWSMNAKKSEVSDINECGDKYVIVKVNSIIPAGYLPFEEVKEEITPSVTERIKVDAMYEKMVAANYTDLSSFANAISEPIDTLNSVKFSSNRLANIGYEPAINAAAAVAPLNKVIPVKGDRAVYLLNVINRTADNTPLSEEEAKTILNNMRAGAVRSQAINQVIIKSKIEDNRSRFQ